MASWPAVHMRTDSTISVPEKGPEGGFKFEDKGTGHTDDVAAGHHVTLPITPGASGESRHALLARGLRSAYPDLRPADSERSPRRSPTRRSSWPRR